MIFLVICSLCNAQKMRFSDTTNKWVTLQDSTATGPVHIITYHKYSGTILINGHNYSKFGGYGLRDDTVEQKVFAYQISGVFCDNIEHLLYDYSMKVGDTFWTFHCGDTIGYRVQSVDSVFIKGKWHRKQYLQCAFHCGFATSFYVVEGIGSTVSPLFPLNPRNAFPDKLICFSNKGVSPPISSPDIFNNTTSCTTGIEDLITPTSSLQIIPNPVSATTRILFPSTVINGRLCIHDLSERLIFERKIVQSGGCSVSTEWFAPGVYFVELTDVPTGMRWVSRLIKN